MKSKMFEELKAIASEEFGVSIKKVKRKTPLTFELLFGISDEDLINMDKKDTIEDKQKVLDILNKFSFILGQRAGRELWLDKPEEVQNEDLSNFNKDIEYIKNYIENSSPTTWHKVADGDLPIEDSWYICALIDGEMTWMRPMKFRNGVFVIPEDPRVFDGIAHKQVIAWAELPKFEE